MPYMPHNCRASLPVRPEKKATDWHSCNCCVYSHDVDAAARLENIEWYMRMIEPFNAKLDELAADVILDVNEYSVPRSSA
jgi:hypothetical protein